MIFRQLERLSKSKSIQKLMVVTSSESSDDPLAKMCTENGIAVFRGSLDDVLDRFYQAALPQKPDHVIRLTGDCPLTDPALIDELIDFHLKGKFDYSSNALEPTFPDGLDAEIFKFSALEEAWKNATAPSDREHVTAYIYKNKKFKIGSLKGENNLSKLRWTVDEPKDFELVTEVFKELYPKNSNFTTNDVLQLLQHRPELATINTSIQRNEGYLKSLKAELKK